MRCVGHLPEAPSTRHSCGLKNVGGLAYTRRVSSDIPQIDGYQIERVLGQGGMAHVYLATQLSLGRQVAVKVVRFSGPDRDVLASRFEHEARTLAQLEHPAIVSIFDVGRTDQGLPYYTMAYLPNGDLSQQGRGQDPQRIADILSVLAKALRFAHMQGIVHRDVKPENVLFDREQRPRLADFGISRSMRGDVRITAEGLAPGSAAYMSPEQARGDNVDARSDLYSLGVLAYELLVGQTPYLCTDPLAMALAHHQVPIPRLPPDLSKWQSLIDKAMAKRPEDRFQNADQFLQALLPLQQSFAQTEIKDAVVLRAPFVSVRPIMVWALLLTVLVAVSALLLQQWQSHASPDPEISVAAAHKSSSAAAKLDPALIDLPERISTRHWFEPYQGSASRLISEALGRDRNAQHLALADDFVTAVGAVVAEAYDQGRDVVAMALDAKLQDFIGAEKLADRKSVRETRRSVHQVLEQRLSQAEQAQAPQLVHALRPVFAGDDALDERWQKLAAQWNAGQVFQDAGGPKMRLLEVAGVRLAMAETEVTRADYLRFQRAEPRAHTRCRALGTALSLVVRQEWSDPGFTQDGKHPVVCVTAEDALAYTAWLSRETGQNYRLPRRQEWQAAAAQIDAKRSPCALGNVLDRSDGRKLVIRDRHDCTDGAEHTRSVASYPATSWGLRDLVGNVSEWVSDCPAKHSDCRTFRATGSSWRSGSDQSLLGVREARDRAALDIGFRVVRTF